MPGTHLVIGIIIHIMMVQCNSLNDGQVSWPKSGFTNPWLEAFNLVMLMVGPNQDTQQEAQRSIGVHPRAKLITRNCLEKHLVKNLPLDACGWAGQS